jgi:hypothetical protein
MNFDDVQGIWASAYNQPTAQEVEMMKQMLNKTLRAKYRGFLAIAALASVWMTIPAVQLLKFALGGGNFDPRQEWGSIALLSLPLLALAILARQYRRHRVAHSHFEESIQASLRAALDENRLARTRTKIIAVLNAAMLAAMPLIVMQLRAAGKAGDEILVPAFVILPVIIAVVLGTMGWHYARTLKPKQKELEAVLAEYDEKLTDV